MSPVSRRLRIVEQASIPAPPEQVWEVIADPTTHTAWRPALVEFALVSPPPLAVGSSIREVLRFGRRTMELDDTVIRLEPPRVLGIDGESRSTQFGLELRVEPDSDGSVVTCDWWLEARSTLLRLILPLLRRSMQKATAEELELLRAYVERRGGRGTNTLVER